MLRSRHYNRTRHAGESTRPAAAPVCAPGAGGSLVIATWCQREETPDEPFTARERGALQFLYDEWAHPFFVSVQEYGRLLEVPAPRTQSGRCVLMRAPYSVCSSACTARLSKCCCHVPYVHALHQHAAPGSALAVVASPAREALSCLCRANGELCMAQARPAPSPHAEVGRRKARAMSARAGDRQARGDRRR